MISRRQGRRNAGLQIEDCISFLLAKASQQVTQRFRSALGKHGVTPVQYAILSVLWESDGLSSAELTARLAIDSATMTGVVDRMELAGLLARSAHPDDRRVNRVALTLRGRALRRPLIKAVVDLNEEVAGELGREAATFREALRRLGAVSPSKA